MGENDTTNGVEEKKDNVHGQYSLYTRLFSARKEPVMLVPYT